MAVDEALLESGADGWTLRFYQWETATLSLGYFQPLADRASHPASAAAPVVRRASGGGAILHDRELTYCLVVPALALPGRKAERFYELVHRALIETLAALGVSSARLVGTAAETSRGPGRNEPFLCFQRRSAYDVVLGDIKLAGSAQRRKRHAIAQHGSVLLARSASAPELPGVQEAAGTTLDAVKIDASTLAAAWQRPLATALELTLVPSERTAAETSLAKELHASRFAADDWTAKR